VKLYSENNFYKLYQGSMLDMLDNIEENSIDSIVTDPPYELNFMGKGWDNAGVSFQPDTWKKCYEVLKPGGYLLAFGGSRTFHRIACAIEDAGFEIRDTIMWLYGSGFPKSFNIAKSIEGKLTTGSGNTKDFAKLNGEKLERGHWGIAKLQKEQGYRNKDYDVESQNEKRLGKLNPTTDLAKKWQGWGTCLKPSFEPIIVARKPFKGSLVDNVIEYGVGGLNIDECRVGTEKVGGGTMPDLSYVGQEQKKLGNGHKMSFGQVSNAPRIECEEHDGRFPANTILTYDETDFDEVCGGFPNNKASYRKGNRDSRKAMFDFGSQDKTNQGYTDSGSASRYFYCAKASKKDRDEGLDDFEEASLTLTENKGRTFNDRCAICGKKFIGPQESICHCENPITDKTKSAPRKNIHPTVKPCDLMQYLVRLVTPNGGTILDPFNGSGSTGKAVMYENKERNKNYKYIGIELTEEYLPISKARIEYVCKDLKTVQTSLDLSDLD